MEKYRLLCKKENEAILKELFLASNILIDQEASITLCEQGITTEDNNDVIIYFRTEKISTLLKLLTKDKPRLSLLMGKIDENYVPIEIKNVVFFNACGNNTYANTIDGKQYKIRNKLYELEEEILSRRFIRINKSEIVNISHIIRITPLFNGRFILKLKGYKEQVDISRNYIKKFKERMGM